jgi:hypothetical protein
MSRYVVKKVNGMWEFWPQANWFMRYFGFAQVKSTDEWVWVTRFETQREAFAMAEAWAMTDGDYVPEMAHLYYRLTAGRLR